MLERTDAYHGIPVRQNELANGRTRRLITGRDLARCSKRSVPESAFVGADLHLNRIEPISLTIGQSAYLAGACPAYVAAASVIVAADDQATREAVLSGRVSLLNAAKSNSEILAERLVRLWARTDDKTHEQFVRNYFSQLWGIIDTITA